ncbi:MAG: bifunctional chorismate mutase/prephenate dehydratase [Candidatus Aminicenantes bacterium]|nr:bifunctional chorismate mutase/prephenate dehydratase [Candidatus Aminicenantes bacterium]
MDLVDIRRKIDETDFKLLKLLEERMEWALRARRLKPAVADREREKEVLGNAAGAGMHLIRPEFSRDVFERIIVESKRLQDQSRLLVGFQGEHGAFSEEAARAYFPDQVTLPHPEFEDVFRGTEEGALDFGVVPVENTLGGAVTRINEILLKTPLHVVGEIHVRVRHCLLSLPGTDPKDIKAVYSHPQALAQCQSFLRRNRLEARPFYDTAGAARMLIKDRPQAAAAIAGELCASLYHLEVIKAGIEDRDSNVTRFLIMGREPLREAGDKCSLVFWAAHEAGSLYRVLRIFADAGINLTRIESFPWAADPSRYAFFLDFQGSPDDPPVADALERFRTEARSMRLLGCYREAQT